MPRSCRPRSTPGSANWSCNSTARSRPGRPSIGPPLRATVARNCEAGVRFRLRPGVAAAGGGPKGVRVPPGAAGPSAERWRPALEAAGTGKSDRRPEGIRGLAEADANDPAAWFNVGLVRAWLGDNHRAVEALNRSIDLETDEAEPRRPGPWPKSSAAASGWRTRPTTWNTGPILQIRDPDAVGKAINDLGQEPAG